jgi:hypothetical protein
MMHGRRCAKSRGQAEKFDIMRYLGVQWRRCWRGVDVQQTREEARGYAARRRSVRMMLRHRVLIQTRDKTLNDLKSLALQFIHLSFLVRGSGLVADLPIKCF